MSGKHNAMRWLPPGGKMEINGVCRAAGDDHWPAHRFLLTLRLDGCMHHPYGHHTRLKGDRDVVTSLVAPTFVYHRENRRCRQPELPVVS